MKPANKIKQAQFIAEYISNGGNKSAAAKTIGINRDTALKWFKNDPDFARRLEEAEEELYEGLKLALLERAKEKSDTLGIFFLKAKYPEIYDDNYRKIRWEQQKEDELRQKYPLPQIQIVAEPKLEEPKES